MPVGIIDDEYYFVGFQVRIILCLCHAASLQLKFLNTVGYFSSFVTSPACLGSGFILPLTHTGGQIQNRNIPFDCLSGDFESKL